MVEEAGMPHKYWGEAVSHESYPYNWRASGFLNMKSPFEPFFGKVGTSGSLKVFDCQVYSQIHKANRISKLHDHAETGVNFGIDSGPYRIMLTGCKQVITTKHMTFDEGLFPFCSGKSKVVTLMAQVILSMMRKATVKWKRTGICVHLK